MEELEFCWPPDEFVPPEEEADDAALLEVIVSLLELEEPAVWLL